jgi:hypothetical protein
LRRLNIDLGAILAVAFVLSALASGQNNQAAARTVTVMGTVTDVNGDAIPNASIVVKEVEGNAPRTIVTTDNGLFEFHDVTSGITYQLTITAEGFSDMTTGIVQVGPKGLHRSRYRSGNLLCSQCQASWKYSGLLAKVGEHVESALAQLPRVVLPTS